MVEFVRIVWVQNSQGSGTKQGGDVNSPDKWAMDATTLACMHKVWEATAIDAVKVGAPPAAAPCCKCVRLDAVRSMIAHTEQLVPALLTCLACLQEKPQWWKKRKSSIVKAHMLLLAHLGRADIPDSLTADHKSVARRAFAPSL